jgi:fibronectin type 3 domain-containing protein
MKTLTAAVFGVALSLYLAPAAFADTAGLVAAYGFEETTGTAAVDSSGAGNAGVFNGATRFAAGRFGSAASFDGVNDRIDIADSNSLDLSAGMTLEAWVQPYSGGWRTAIMKERPGGIAYGLYESTDTNRPSVEIQQELRGPSAVPGGAWSHLATSYDGATLRLYLNGTQVAGRAVTGALTISSGALRIGGNAVWGEYFSGLIDEVRIYNRALTAAEVQGDMNAPVVSSANPVPKPTGLTATTLSNGRDVDLHWNWVDAATDYNVYRDGVKIRNTTANYAGDLGLALGTYRYTVTAVGSGRESAPSDEASVTITDNTPPGGPWLTGSVTSDDVHLAWDPATDNFGVKEYRVYRGSTLLATRDRSTLAYDDLDRPVGTYLYKVVAVDDGGLTGTSRDVTLTVEPDTTPPTGTLGVCNGAVLHDYAVLMARFEDDRGPVTASVYIDGVLFRGPYTPGGRSGSLMFEWELLNRVPDGLHLMTLALRDGAGNEATIPCEWNVQNPTVTAPFVTPSDGDTISGTVKVSAKPTWDNDPPLTGDLVRVVAYSVDGVSLGYSPSTPYEVTWDTTKVANGLHTIKAEVYWMDYGAPRATQTIQVRVDNTLPRPAGVTASESGGVVDVRWSAVTGATEYRVFRDGERIATVTGTQYTDAVAQAGTHSYTVVAAKGSVTSDPSDAATVTVSPDRTAPTVTLQAGCDGRALNDYIGPIHGTASDDGGRPVTVTVDVGDQRLLGPQSLTDGTFSFYWDTRKHANGPVVMKVTARDAAGNETVKDCPWTVSNRALSVPITGAADGGTVSGTVSLGFQPRADGVATTAGAFLQIDGAAVASTGSAPYTYSWDTTKVANGVHTIKASMYWLDYPTVMATATIQVTVSNAGTPPTGLVAAYGFEQTAGTSVTDSSGKGSTGTLAGATWAADGKSGRALSFDGVNDIVTVPDSNLLDLGPGMTLEAWVKPTTVSDWRTVVLKERPGQLTYSLYASGEGGRPMAEIATGVQRDARGAAALQVGVWTHLAATYDKSTLKLYVNGTLVSSTAVTGTLLNSTGALKIGGNAVWGEYFGGLIDDVRLYERALSAAEIAADKDRAV